MTKAAVEKVSKKVKTPAQQADIDAGMERLPDGSLVTRRESAMTENNQARIGTGIPASVSPVLADMEIRDLKERLAAAEAERDQWKCLEGMAVANVRKYVEQLAAAEVAFKNEVQIVIEQRDSIESLIWRFRDIQFPRDAVQTAIDLAKEETT